MQNTVSITCLYAGLLTLLYAKLLLGVVKRRWALKAAFGHADDRDLESAIRAHGNFAEYVPLMLLFLLLGELSHVPKYFLHGYGMLLVIARILHAYSFYVYTAHKFRHYRLRYWSTLVTWWLMVIAAITSIGLFIYPF